MNNREGSTKAPAYQTLFKELVDIVDQLQQEEQAYNQKLAMFAAAEQSSKSGDSQQDQGNLPEALEQLRTVVWRLRNIRSGLNSLRTRLEI